MADSPKNLVRFAEDLVVTVFGDSGVGKSTFISKLTGDRNIRIRHDLMSGRFRMVRHTDSWPLIKQYSRNLRN
jgi:putative ribosome biogenesis GTPase RsgA